MITRLARDFKQLPRGRFDSEGSVWTSQFEFSIFLDFVSFDENDRRAWCLLHVPGRNKKLSRLTIAANPNNAVSIVIQYQQTILFTDCATHIIISKQSAIPTAPTITHQTFAISGLC
jgi:hypothetical protein